MVAAKPTKDVAVPEPTRGQVSEMVTDRVLDVPDNITWDQFVTQYQARTTETALGILGIEKDKDELCGMPLALVGWVFNDGDFGPFVSVTFVEFSKDGRALRKGVFNDGSTGIYRQLKGYTDKCVANNAVDLAYGPLMTRAGLRVSEYTPTDEEGEPLVVDGKVIEKARTYYLS